MDVGLSSHPVIAFLRRHRARLFADVIQVNGDLVGMLNRYTLILALDDSAMSNLRSVHDEQEILAIVRNHLSILPVNKDRYPAFTSIDGFQYGNNIQELHTLGVSTAGKIMSMVVMIIRQPIFPNIEPEIEEAVPPVDETTATYIESLPYDIFVQMAISNDIKGRDLINLCEVNEAIRAKCDKNEQLLFRRLLKRDYQIHDSQDPRQDYVRMMKASLYTCGLNGNGQLGLGDTLNRYSPTKVQEVREINRVICGWDRMAILTIDGRVMMCGDLHYYTPVERRLQFGLLSPITGLPEISQVACGKSYTAFLTAGGRVYMAGYNSHGQFGIRSPHVVEFTPPILIPNLNNIVQISCGVAHSAFLTSTGEVLMSGRNNRGQLGLGSTKTAEWPLLVAGLEGISQIICGGEYTMFLTKDGRVYACGRNSQGQLGLGDYVDRNVPTLIPNMEGIIHVSCSGNESNCHSAFLKDDGSVLICGYSGVGQLGLGRDIIRINTPTRVPSLSRIVQVACGHSHTVFLTEKGRVFACGHNEYGELGLPDKSARFVPTLIRSLKNVVQIAAGHHSAFLVA